MRGSRVELNVEARVPALVLMDETRVHQVT